MTTTKTPSLLFFTGIVPQTVIVSLMALALLATVSRADVTITTDTTQNGGTYTVSPAGVLIVNNVTNPTLNLTNFTATSGVMAVIVGNTAHGALSVNSGAVLSNSGTGSLIGTYGSQTVFTGDSDGYMMALDGVTGKVLWHFATGAAIRSPAISYTFHGKQYIAMVSGQNLLAFKLP